MSDTITASTKPAITVLRRFEKNAATDVASPVNREDSSALSPLVIPKAEHSEAIRDPQ
jgi:hypothetical protein